MPTRLHHVFFIHSNISYLVARQIVAHERLNPADCVFLLMRGFGAPADCPVRAVSMEAVNVALTPQIWEVWQRIKAFDRQVDAQTGRAEFHLYVPHTDNATARLLYTHPRCKGLSYMEEGLASYNTAERWRERWVRPFSFTDQVLRYLATLGRLPTIEPLASFYHKVYCLDARCFPGMARKVVLPLPFRQVRVTPNPAGQAVLVFDALVEFGLADPEPLCQAYRELLDWLLSHGREQVLFKYHPVQAKDPARRALYEQQIFAPYRDRVTFSELTADVSLEDLAVSYPDVTFAILVSSVGFYAGISGQRVVSTANQLARTSPKFAKALTEMPPIFFEVTEFLPETAPVS